MAEMADRKKPRVLDGRQVSPSPEWITPRNLRTGPESQRQCLQTFRYGSPLEIILGLGCAPASSQAMATHSSCLPWESTVDRGAW